MIDDMRRTGTCELAPGLGSLLFSSIHRTIYAFTYPRIRNDNLISPSLFRQTYAATRIVFTCLSIYLHGFYIEYTV